jgi:hypothetical protein
VHSRQARKRLTQLREIARACALQRHSREATLDIADVFEQFVQRSGDIAIYQRADRLQAQLDRAAIA